jgi:hypothetical protein
MLWMEVVIPAEAQIPRELLLSKIQREFVDATGFQDEKLYVRFSEYGQTDLGESGSFSSANMAHVVVYCPRLRFDVKRSLASGITSAFAGHDCKPLIHIFEFPYENIAVDGTLLTDADDELASRPFYYVIPH